MTPNPLMNQARTTRSGAGDKPARGITSVSRDDPEYLRLRDLEIQFWSHDYGLGSSPTQADLSDLFVRYTNRRFTGDERVFWYECIRPHGPFENALVLGAGGVESEACMLELNDRTHFTFCELTPYQTEKRRKELEERFPGRVTTQETDLNFPDFPAGTYDLIVSSGTIHHLVNLDAIGEQINRALTPDGYFFLQDYVGESRFAFSAVKRRVFEALYARALRLRGESAPLSLHWNEVEPGSNHSPFEAVRSADTLEIMRSHLIEEQLRTAGAVAGLMIFASPAEAAPATAAARRPLLRRLLARLRPPRRTDFHDILLVDEILCDAGLLLPTNAFAIYRKRPDPAPDLG
jgi:SAM-dependent methyltransferase